MMLPLLRAEFKKLLTVRSTYFILGIALLLEGLFAFYGSGMHSSRAELQNPGFLADQVTSAVNVLSLLAALVGILLVTHEYRYNTIMYTLTNSKSRTRVLLAKFLVTTCFAVVFTIVYGTLSPILAKLGIAVHGGTLGPQHIDVWNLLWRSVTAGWAFVMLGTAFAMLIRVQVGAIAALFLVPGTVEPLLSVLLKDNQQYLPFTAVNGILDIATQHIKHGKAALIALVYVAIFWIAAWILFKRRDAN